MEDHKRIIFCSWIRVSHKHFTLKTLHTNTATWTNFHSVE